MGRGAFGTSVTVVIETLPPAVNALLVTLDAVREILNEYSWFSFTRNYCHAQIAVMNDSFGEVLRLCGDRLVSIHARSK
ncbi:MAG: sugar phosphate isomerase/epimerase [Methanocalculaceae archaeon]|nr:sugar phosphate isomerase/epimerase [Methanocalculaceae archaeon]